MDHEIEMYCYLWSQFPAMHRYMAAPVVVSQYKDGVNRFTCSDLKNRYVSILATELCQPINKGKFRDADKVVWFVTGFLSALSTLHDVAGVLHGDMSRGNVMMDGDNVKLIDFQFSLKNMTHDSCVEAFGWTEKYSAPVKHWGVVRFASDVYAAARVIDAVCDNSVIDGLKMRNLLNRMLSVKIEDIPRASEALLEVQRMRKVLRQPWKK